MKLQTHKDVQNTIQGLETAEFKVAVNPKTFRIMLDGLYSNKIKAVVREIWTNAFDAHIMAGIESFPFDCHLPSALDPTFRVRDYGVSLSHHDVMNLYTTLFDSTKDDSNDAVGALGLGSKSPFAYTDSFTVIARLDGEKRTYLASMADTGIPQITLLSNVPTDEAQGLEISIVVENKDFASFKDEAKQLATGFDPLPNVDGVEIAPVEPVYVAQDGSFAIFSEDYRTSDRLAVRQGCVIYPVDDYSLTREIQNFLNYGYKMIIDVPIGAVSITASREALELTDKTRDYLRERVTSALKQINSEVYAEADKCANLFEARKFWFEQGSNKNLAFRITPKYKEMPISNNFTLIPTKLVTNKAKWPTWVPFGKRGNSKTENRFINFEFTKRKEYKFITTYDDKKVVRSVARYRTLTKNAGWEKDNIFLLKNPEKKTLEMLQKHLGLSKEQIRWIGDLPDPGKTTRGANGSGALQGVYSPRGYGSWDKVVSLPVDRDGKECYHWVRTDRICKSDIYTLDGIKQTAKELGITSKPIVLISPTAEKKLKPSESDNLRALIKYKKAALKEDVKRAYTDSLYNNLIEQNHLKNVVATKQYNASHRAMMNTVLTYEEREACQAQANDDLKSVKEKYPLLFDHYDEKYIKEYIALKDAQESSKESS